MRTSLLITCLSMVLFAHSQNKFIEPSDSLNKKRLIWTSTSTLGVWSGSQIALAQVWYSAYPKTPWHTFNDASNWLQMDKVGHVYSCYQLSSLSAKTFRWSGLKPKVSALIGFGVGWGYQLGFEMLDARSANWGFSWSDLAANTLGGALFLGQELGMKDQFIKLKFSYQESGLAQYRPSHLGSTLPEKILKDYNAQTYWLSFSPFYFSHKNISWLAIAVGYSAHNKMVGDQETFTTADGLHTFDSKREFILSLDVDVKQLPIKKRWLKMLVSPFNTIKFPFPAIVWQGNTCYLRRSY